MSAIASKRELDPHHRPAPLVMILLRRGIKLARDLEATQALLEVTVLKGGFASEDLAGGGANLWRSSHGRRFPAANLLKPQEQGKTMCRKALLVAILGLCVAASGTGPGLSEERNRGTMGITLTFLERHKIEDKAQGLKEPSGLALAPARDGLWTVSDDTGKVFRLDLQGRLDASGSFPVPLEGLEGITLDEDGAHLVVVKEEDRGDSQDQPNEIIRIGLEERAILERRRLDELAGYEDVVGHFESGEENKGLEGITWNPDSGSFFLLKEGEPGLLLEVSADLRSLLSHRVLSGSNGFRDDDSSSEKIDYSGLVYDPSRTAFWIVSDKARRLFLYDPAADAVLQHTALGYEKDGEYREIKKAEGVAIDPEGGRLYVVSDDEARLYVFDLRG